MYLLHKKAGEVVDDHRRSCVRRLVTDRDRVKRRHWSAVTLSLGHDRHQR